MLARRNATSGTRSRDVTDTGAFFITCLNRGFDLRDIFRFLDSIANDSDNAAVNHPFVPKPHLNFSRVDVDINGVRFHRQEEQCDRLPIFRHHCAECFGNRGTDNAAADGPLIQEGELIVPIRLCKVWLPEQTIRLQIGQFLLEFNEVLSEFLAVDEPRAFQIRITGADIQDGSAVMCQRELDTRMCKRSPCHLIRDMVHLRSVGFEELESRGDVVKEIVNRHVRAGRTTTLLDRTEDTTVNVHLCPLHCIRCTGEQLKLRDRSDTR